MKNTLSALLLASAGILAAAPVLEIRRAEDFSFPAWAGEKFFQYSRRNGESIEQTCRFSRIQGED